MFIQSEFFVVLYPLDEESVGRLPPRCCWQYWLQEHLLRHHTRRGEGGVNGRGDKTENEEMNMHPSLLYSPSLFSVFLLLLCVSSSLSSFPSSLLLSSTYSLRLSKDLSRWGWIGRVERLMTTVSVKRGYGIVFNKMNTISLSLTYSLILSVSHSLPTTTSHACCCIFCCCLEGWRHL